MNSFLQNNVYFGFFLAIGSYLIGVYLQKRFPYTIFNPLLVSTLICIAVLLLFRIDYEVFDAGASHITYFLTPCTVCLAIPMYRHIMVLKKNLAAILISIFSGCLAAALSIWGLCKLFHLNAEVYHSLQPKSVTTAIAMGVSEELGGITTLTVAAVVVTGLFGAVAAKSLLRIFRIKHPIAVGLAIGNSAHALGTSRAMEIGELEGAMSSLAVVVAGIVTVLLASIFSGLIS